MIFTPGVQLGQPDEGDHQKGSGAGAVVSVVAADDKGGGPDNGGLLFEADLPGLVGPVVAAQGNHRHHRQHRQQHVFQDGVRRAVLKPGADDGARQREGDGGGEERPVHIAVFDEPGGGEDGADGGGDLVGPQGVGRRQAAEGNEMGRTGDDSAAAGDGVHEGGQKYAQAQQQNDPQSEAVNGDLRKQGKHRRISF